MADRSVNARGWRWRQAETIKKHMRGIWGDGTVLYLDCDDSYMNLPIHVSKFIEPYTPNPPYYCMII